MKARLPQGMGGGAGNLQSMVKQAQKMQEQMATTQAELEEKTYTASAGGVVSATVSGKHEIVRLEIAPEAIDPDDVQMLEDLVMGAVNEAMRAADKDAAEQMGKISGGMNITGLF